MKDALEDVKITEQQAKTLLEEAEKEARVIISNARDEGEKLLLDAKKRGEAEGNKIVKQAEDDATNQAGNLSKEHEEKVKHLEKFAAAKINKAVDMIVERIVKAHGNS